MGEQQRTHWKKVESALNFMGEADFQDGEEKILTIGRINTTETAPTAEGKSKKAVIHWKEKHRLQGVNKSFPCGQRGK